MAIGCVAMIGIIGGPATQAVASTTQVHSLVSRAQNVDWLSSQTASSLNLGFTVLVPGSVPSPFGGEPSVSASGGYYSLYWMNVSADPTFLQITGQVGGGLPAGSPYDLNNQLFVNASVQGYDAIHDVTPIYDQVWWIADGVLYSVASKNLDGTDSLSLANSLVALQAPSDPGGGDTPPETAEPTVDPGPTAAPVQPTISAQGSVTAGDTIAVSIGDAVNVNLNADGGTFADSGDTAVYNVNGGDYNWQAPAVSTKKTYTITITSPQTGETLASTQIIVSPAAQSTGNDSAPAQSAETGPANPQPSPTDVSARSTDVPTQAPGDSGAGNGTGPQANANGTASSPTVTPAPINLGSSSLSDGTDGPPPPVVGGDGTGGVQIVMVPESTGVGPQP